MTEQTKAYFHHMYEVSYAFGKAKEEREKEKAALIAADNWDAVHDWYEREKQFGSPYTTGQFKAYWAFDRSSEIESEEMLMTDSLWEREVKDFSDTLKAAGVTTFVLAHQSTGLMEDIHNLETQGWRLVGTCKVTTTRHRWGDDETEVLLGLRFEIGEEA